MWPHVAHKVRRGPNASRLIFPLFAPLTILIPGGHMVTLKIAHVCDVNLLIASEEDFWISLPLGTHVAKGTLK